jgi:hypothetical protein
MAHLVPYDRTQQVPTTGIPLVSPNARRLWLAFTNYGPNIVDLTWIGNDGATITGRIRLQAGQGVWMSRKSLQDLGGDMFWDGAISAVSYVATTTIAGIEVEQWD